MPHFYLKAVINTLEQPSSFAGVPLISGLGGTNVTENGKKFRRAWQPNARRSRLSTM
jgi:hypothetical protein